MQRFHYVLSWVMAEYLQRMAMSKHARCCPYFVRDFPFYLIVVMCSYLNSDQSLNALAQTIIFNQFFTWSICITSLSF